MKRLVHILVIAAATLMTAVGCASSNSSQSEELAGLKEAIEARDFEINARQAFPTSGRSVYLTSMYPLTIKGNKVTSHLPYYGRAYSIPYGGGDGLRFEGDMTGYTVKYGKKNRTDISFSVKTKEDNYKFNITIFPNGFATINVNPNNRQSISYNGEVNLGEAFR